MNDVEKLRPPTNTPTEWSGGERPLLLQLADMDWQYMPPDIDVAELTRREKCRRGSLRDCPVESGMGKGGGYAIKR